MIERRQFSRVVYQVPSEISQEHINVSGSVQDLSLHGLLIQCDELQRFSQDTLFTLALSWPTAISTFS